MKPFEYEFVVDRDQRHLVDEMQDWCKDSIGPGGWIIRDHCVWSLERAFGITLFNFKHQRDRDWFALRWS